MLYSCKSKLNILYHKFLGTSYAFFVCLWLDLISVANETMAAIQNRIVAIYQCEKKKCPTCKRLGTTSKLKESIKLGCWGMNFVKIWWATSIWSYSQILSVTTSIQWAFCWEKCARPSLFGLNSSSRVPFRCIAMTKLGKYGTNPSLKYYVATTSASCELNS